MADNIIVPGLGAVIATDQATDATLGTAQFQYIKIADGTLGGTTKAAVGAAGLKVDPSGATAPVSLVAATSGGLTTYKLISAATTNATSVATGARQLYNIQAFNRGAPDAYLKLYNLAVAPTVGTSVPLNVWLIPVGGPMLVLEFTNGIVLGAGLAISIQGGFADADTTAVAVGEIVLNLQYK